ncbi:hypothetical protein HWV62_36406 [Athelia sp. TMB]|nr:hypothetical protein HWV62_36406 [Athelia sp. TMB]
MSEAPKKTEEEKMQDFIAQIAVQIASVSKNTKAVGVVPSKFKGEKKTARKFISSLQLYIKNNSETYDTEEKKLGLAYSLCDKSAAGWIQPYIDRQNFGEEQVHLAKYKAKLRKAKRKLKALETAETGADSDSESSEDKEEEDLASSNLVNEINTFNDFVTLFKETWTSAQPAAEARNTINRMSQGKDSLVDYTTKFMLVAADTGYSDLDLRERYPRGLNRTIREVLAEWKVDTSSFRALKKAVEEVVNLRAEFLDKDWAPSHNAPSKSTSTSNNTQSQKQRPFPNDQGIAPMVIDSGKIVCYNCYEIGHMKNKCTNPKKPYRKVIYSDKKSYKKPVRLLNIDGTNNEGGSITHYSVLDMEINGQTMEDFFTVANIGGEDIIIGIDWLRTHDPKISFKNGTFQLPLSDTLTIATTSESEEEDEKIKAKLPERY